MLFPQSSLARIQDRNSGWLEVTHVAGHDSQAVLKRGGGYEKTDTRPSFACTNVVRNQEEKSVMTGYCLRCRANREMLEPVQIKMSDGSPAIQGRCAECGTAIVRIGRVF